MKRKLFFILSLFLISSIYVFGENFPQKAKTVNDFIPKGWKEILTTNGDLNKDKLEDTVIVIEKEDKKNIKKNDVLGPDYLNLNPRILLVLFKQKDGTYILASKNDKGFIQSENDEENPNNGVMPTDEQGVANATNETQIEGNEANDGVEGEADATE